MESDEVLSDRAAADLAALQTDRTALADRLRQPGWYDPALGVLVAGFYSSYSFAYPWVTLGALPVFFVGIGLLIAAYRRRTGSWVNGFHGGPSTKPLVRWSLVVAGVLLVAGLVAEFGFGVRYAMVAIGVVLGVGAAVASRRWTTLHQRDLRGQL
ncbi:hypothetical protein SAMN05660199_02761 [Klenkia soli]|uniref:Uncharacterized protein n=1 Tax=Klenkia soli TaxID=1052260 RepID=A0A1H0N6L9_9ACTN|nr:hypothetical protein [Klenkia soli]SDO88323.1 hypothetical protein SAMN05660199_02761 [Klenkia soli]